MGIIVIINSCFQHTTSESVLAFQTFQFQQAESLSLHVAATLVLFQKQKAYAETLILAALLCNRQPVLTEFQFSTKTYLSYFVFLKYYCDKTALRIHRFYR